MTLAQIKERILKRSKAEGRTVGCYIEGSVTWRCLNQWLAGERKNVIGRAWSLMRSAGAFLPGEVPVIDLHAEGEDLVVLRRSDYEALQRRPVPAPAERQVRDLSRRMALAAVRPSQPIPRNHVN